MQVRLLGPVDVVVRGEPRPVHGLRRKTVLAVLALHGRGIVSTDELADAVWGQDAPPTAVNSLHTHVSYLRGVLGAKTAILARPPLAAARKAWTRAMWIFEEIGHPDRDRVRAKLRVHDHPAPPPDRSLVAAAPPAPSTAP
jgi:Transcriptional regulatory protein, C terminal